MLVGQAVALEAFKALALMLSSMMGLISLALAPLLEDHAATACQTFYLEGVLRLHKIKFALYIIVQFSQTGMS